MTSPCERAARRLATQLAQKAWLGLGLGLGVGIGVRVWVWVRVRVRVGVRVRVRVRVEVGVGLPLGFGLRVRVAQKALYVSDPIPSRTSMYSAVSLNGEHSTSPPICLPG